ncbi:MAG: hypothetical protein ACJ786_00145 [Catenulispora sp.]
MHFLMKKNAITETDGRGRAAGPGGAVLDQGADFTVLGSGAGRRSSP